MKISNLVLMMIFSFYVDQSFGAIALQKKTGRLSDFGKKFQCPDCVQAFELQHNFDRHQKIHNQQKNFQCSFCKSCFFERDLCRAHISKQHPESTAYVQNVSKLKAVDKDCRTAVDGCYFFVTIDNLIFFIQGDTCFLCESKDETDFNIIGKMRLEEQRLEKLVEGL